MSCVKGATNHMESPADPAALLIIAQRNSPLLLTDLATLVDIDSGTYTPKGIKRIADLLQKRFAASGCSVEHIPGGEFGSHLVARLRGRGTGRILLVGHMDTVFPEGEAKRRPFTMHEGRAYGPGVYDMKAGLLIGLYALRTVLEVGQLLWEELIILYNSDEEIGSPSSHDLIAALATGCDAAL